MEQVQKPKSHSGKEETVEGEPVRVAKDQKIEEDKQYADDLLDEIDGLLEENAEAFVANYIQGGGE